MPLTMKRHLKFAMSSAHSNPETREAGVVVAILQWQRIRADAYSRGRNIFVNVRCLWWSVRDKFDGSKQISPIATWILFENRQHI